VKQAFSSQIQDPTFTQSWCFSKSMRLLNASDFKTVFDDAPLRASHAVFLLLARPNHLTLPRLGLVIAKKHIRLAVDRNRVKRLIRETFRAKQQQLVGIDVIVLARKGMNELSNKALIEQLDSQWQRLIRRTQKTANETHAVPVSTGFTPCAN
jgi:ribonuclease P protein component